MRLGDEYMVFIILFSTFVYFIFHNLYYEFKFIIHTNRTLQNLAPTTQPLLWL